MSAELTALALGLLSAITLAAANVAVKMGTDILVGRAILSTISALIVLPAAFLVPLPDGQTAAAIALAVPAHFFYQMCLVQAMQRGELSLAFPVMRGVAPLLTAGAALLFLGEELAPLAWIGLLVATAAVIAFALPPRGTALRRHPDAVLLGWALATAVGIALYNVADARGVRIAPDPFTYIVWLFLLDPIGVAVVAFARRRRQLAEAIALRWRYGAAAGFLSVLSYGSAVYAFSLVETAKVSAVRETAVVFAALMGATMLKESFGARRMLAALALAAGLVAMQFAR